MVSNFKMTPEEVVDYLNSFLYNKKFISKTPDPEIFPPLRSVLVFIFSWYNFGKSYVTRSFSIFLLDFPFFGIYVFKILLNNSTFSQCLLSC